MTLEEFYKYLGVISFALTWIAVVCVLLKNPRELDKSISHHAAMRRNTYIIFASLITFALIAMLGFLLFWLAPILKLNAILVILFLAALVLELATTWIPLKEGKKYHIHNFLSYSTALLMPLIVLGIILTNTVSGSALFIAYGALAIMTGLLITFFTIPKSLEKYLLHQSIYIATFQLAIIGIPFL